MWSIVLGIQKELCFYSGSRNKLEHNAALMPAFKFGGKFERLRIDWDTWNTHLGVKCKGEQKQISALLGKLKMDAKKKSEQNISDYFCLRLQYSSVYHCYQSHLYLKCWPFVYHAYIWIFKTLVLLFKYCFKISFILPTGFLVLPRQVVLL